MNLRQKSGLLLLLVFLAVGAWFMWHMGAPRRAALTFLDTFQAALSSNNSSVFLQAVATPVAIQGRTQSEQAEFLQKALRDELSVEGLAVLGREGQFGPLTNIFPVEAAGWAKQVGVPTKECIAFKLERNGQRAEVVLWQQATLNPNQPPSLRLVRCNNVKQLADPKL